MLSILIPTYNYDVLPLVKQLHSQATSEGIIFEIVVIDDASTHGHFLREIEKILTLAHCSLEKLTENIGRSKIRNKLAQSAQYDWLLFLDSDTKPTHPSFIKNYLAQINTDNWVVYGGIHYQETSKKEHHLRHRYGLQRESISVVKRKSNPYHSFITMAFMVRKELFKRVKFNENLIEYGHEDTVFALNLKKIDIPILHIDNPVTHLNLEDNMEFLNKTRKSLKSLLRFYQIDEIGINDVKILKLYYRLSKLKLRGLISIMFYLFEGIFKAQLNTKRPSLLIFDLYRIGYLCSLKLNKHA